MAITHSPGATVLWLLIYKIDADDLHLVRTGTHLDLF